MKRKLRKLALPLGVVIALCAFAASCSRFGKQPTAVQPAQPPFERDMDAVRRTNTKYVYIVRRKDGAPLDKEDRAFIRENTPKEVVMWKITDNDRQAICGTNVDFTNENRAALAQKYVIEDYTGK